MYTGRDCYFRNIRRRRKNHRSETARVDSVEYAFPPANKVSRNSLSLSLGISLDTRDSFEQSERGKKYGRRKTGRKRGCCQYASPLEKLTGFFLGRLSAPTRWQKDLTGCIIFSSMSKRSSAGACAREILKLPRAGS